jgi:hypothetical protein
VRLGFVSGFERPLDVGFELVQRSCERVVGPLSAFVQLADDHCPASGVGF